MNTITVSTPAVHRLVIPGYHPPQRLNSQSKRHWAVIQAEHDEAAYLAYRWARINGWKHIEGRVRLTITLVYPRHYRTDADNLHARCKGLLDGLKDQPARKVRRGAGYVILPAERRFFEDDCTDVLDLQVRTRVEKGERYTEMELEANA